MRKLLDKQFKIRELNHCCFRANSGKQYKSLEELLENEHPEDSVLGYRFQSIRYEQMVPKILSKELTGFVVFKGGEESKKDKVSRLFSFIPQRCKVKPEEVGQVTKDQIKSLYGEERADKEMRKHLEKFFTLTKSYADSSGGVTAMSTSLFRWLIKHRGLKNFRIVHFLAYRYRNYLKDWLEPMLLQRQKLKVQIKEGVPGTKVTSEILKLISNAFYGFSSIMSCHFPKTLVRTASQLESRRSKQLENARSVSLIGCAPAKNKKGGTDNELLFAITKSNSKAKIKNLCQLAAAILSNSKVIFFDALFFFLKHFSAKRAELTYIDTDSSLFSLSSPDLMDVVEEKHKESFVKNVDKYLHNGEPEKHAHGKFKLETLCRGGLFHSPKCYWLGPEVDGKEESRKRKLDKDVEVPEGEENCMKRFKGTSRNAQNALKREHFDLDPATGLPKQGYANRSKLNATMGFEMLLTEESKSLVNPVSVKRRFDVRQVSVF